MVRASTFDYVAYGSSDTYELAFRIIRFPLSESACECIITNLPRDEFPPERIKKVVLYQILRPTTEKDKYDAMSLLQRELIPIRNDRQYPRLQTVHFRKPRYFIYRAA